MLLSVLSHGAKYYEYLNFHHAAQWMTWFHIASHLNLPPLSWDILGLSTYHAEDGIDNDINGYSGWLPPVPHGSHALLVVGQEVIRQPVQSGPGGVMGLETPSMPGWEE